MQSFIKAVIIIIAATNLSCGIILLNPKKPKTIIKKQELVKFKISINEVESVARQGIKAELYIKNIYTERIRFQIPNCLWVASPAARYSNGYPVPMRETIKALCEPEWGELEPGGEFVIEFPYNLFEMYTLELGNEIAVQFSYYGEILDSQSEFLSGNDDSIQSNEIEIKIVEGKYR